MLRALVPDHVVVVETTRPCDWETEPAEDEAIQGAQDARVRDFRVGRACARRALTRLWPAPGEGCIWRTLRTGSQSHNSGATPQSVTIQRGRNGEPLWPDGVCGSITHCRTYAAAVVARRSDVTSLGIDVERNRAFEPGLVRRIATPAEQARLQALPESGVNWPAVLFSAKESIFKAWFPLTRRWLGLLEVDVHLDALGCTFGTQVDRVRLTGRFETTAEHVFTAAVAIPIDAQMEARMERH